MDARVGDHVVVESNRIGQGRREGEITEVLASSARPQLRVRWDDGHESIYIPSGGTTVVPHRR
jgi:hypothetical protein